MTKKAIIALLLAPAAFLGRAHATDVYMYLHGSYVAVNVTKNIDKIIFASKDTHFITAAGDTATLSNDAFNFITFRKLEVPVGIKDAAEHGVVVMYHSDGFYIESEKQLTNVQIIATDGRVIANVVPTDTRLFFPSGSLPAGVYVVKASDGRHTVVKKITKKN